jgi:quercetin dioxygenase-like cupin family protein
MLSFVLLIGAASVACAGEGNPGTESGTAKIDFENDQIRVVHISLAPHQTIPMHSYLSRFVLPLTPNYVRLIFQDGTSKISSRSTRDFFWSDPVTCEIENLSNLPEQELEIEMKQSKGPGVEVKPELASGPRHQGTETDPVPVTQEPHHRLVFANQYAQVLNVTIDPGDTYLYHRHALDHVAIEFEDANLLRQKAGEDWVPGPAVFAHADYNAAYKTPYVHRVTNVGTNTLHVLDIEIFP